MKLVMDQSDALSAEFPAHPGVERFFSGIASAAVRAIHARDTTEELAGRSASDVGTLSDLQIDDLTIAVANISRLAEDESQRPPIRALWGRVLRVLSAELRDRQARR